MTIDTHRRHVTQNVFPFVSLMVLKINPICALEQFRRAVLECNETVRKTGERNGSKLQAMRTAAKCRHTHIVYIQNVQGYRTKRFNFLEDFWIEKKYKLSLKYYKLYQRRKGIFIYFEINVFHLCVARKRYNIMQVKCEKF